MKLWKRLVWFAIAALPLAAQIVTSSLVGTVKDPSNTVVAGAAVRVTHVSTGFERKLETDTTGRFVLSGLDSGEYILIVEKEGFKRYERRGIVLSAAERLSAGEVVLEVGAITQVVNVNSQATLVKTESAERAEVITGKQIDGLLTLGRNVPSLVQLLPGVVVTLESPILDRRTDFNVMGSRRTMNNVTVDGIPSTDIDNAFALKLGVSQDAIAEVQILLSNYQAEYGRSAGANLQMVTKSGSRDFHGLGSYFKRHEQFNAGNFFDNRLGRSKPRYRYHTYTYNVGGPVILPGDYNRNRDKLFFFWSQEFWPNREGSTRSILMPTSQERAGDFSNSLDLNNQLVVIRDPYTSSRAPFAGNRIPANRINPSGQALLNVFDEPNFFDRSLSAGTYNYVFTAENNLPKRTDSLKIDYNLNEKNQFYATYSAFEEVKEGAVGVPAVGPTTWPQLSARFAAHTKGLAGRYTRIFSPTVINEFHFGWFHNPEDHTYQEQELLRNQRKQVGFTAGQLFPEGNVLDLIPNATFGGITGAAQLNIGGRFPILDPNDLYTFNDKITVVRTRHTFKAGIYVETIRRDVSQGVLRNGSFNFGRNVNNPLDTGYAYANAILGVFDSYTEAKGEDRQKARGSRIEAFVQDNWKVRPGLTLDYGLRVYWLPPISQGDNRTASFVAGRYNPQSAVQLIRPGFDSNGRRAGVNPVTGQVYPASLIGALAPGVGDPANGMVVAASDSSYPEALVHSRGAHFAPRFGFAYDPSANGKMAIRGGFGMFYNPLSVSRYRDYVAQQPLVETPVVSFGEISTLASSSGLLFPSNAFGIDARGKVPTVMNYSLSIQRDVAGTVVDVGYVGSLGRNLAWRRNLNAIPFGSNFDPANRDTTLASGPLPAAFLRPYAGYNNVLVSETAATSNYNSLQVTANRRMAAGLQFGLSWTWSKAMDYADEDTAITSTLVPVRVWNYGLSGFDRTHVLKLNWVWDVPLTPWRRGVAGAAFNNWQVSGIASFVSGAPLGIGMSTTRAFDITGSPTDGARVNITGNPILPKSERTFSRNFRTDVFALPAVGTYGNSAKNSIRGPGINNFDIAIFKNFPVREGMRFQFRCELYNAFNHTQFTNLDTAARFELDGRQVNARFGEFTAARDGRQIQLALRFYF